MITSNIRLEVDEVEKLMTGLRHGTISSNKLMIERSMTDTLCISLYADDLKLFHWEIETVDKGSCIIIENLKISIPAE